MRRTALLSVLALAVGLALGAAAKDRKFKYLSDRWNRTVDLTEIELACLQSGFAAREPLTLRKDRLIATEIRPEARATHIHLTVQVEVQGTRKEPPAPRDLEGAAAAACKYWQDDLLKRPISDSSDCPITIDLVQGSKVLYRQIRDARGRRGFLNPDL